MAKKSFKENPALSFITQALEQAAPAPASERAVPAPISDESIAGSEIGLTRAEDALTDTHDNADKYTHTHDDIDVHSDVYDDMSTQTDASTTAHVDTAEEAAAVFASAVPEANANYSESKGNSVPPAPLETAGRTAVPRSGANSANTPQTASEMFAGAARESKSKRLQLLLRPSTHDGIARLARTYQTSVNDIINQVLEDYLKRNG